MLKFSLVSPRALARPKDAGHARPHTERLLPPEFPADYALFFAENGYAELVGGKLRLLGPAARDGRLTLGAFNGPDGWRRSWPAFAGILWVFATDWCGNLWGFDLRPEASHEGRPTLAILDTSEGELVPLFPATLERVLRFGPDEWRMLLQEELWREWVRAGGVSPRFGQVVGFELPPSLGGAEEPGNMALMDLCDYVHEQGQRAAQVPPRAREGARRPASLVPPPDLDSSDLVAALPVVALGCDEKWWRFWS